MSVSQRRVSLFHVADVLISAASPHRVLIAAAAVAAGVLACRDTTTPKEVSTAGVAFDPMSTMGFGFKSTLIARGNLGPFHMKSKYAGYEVELKSHDNTDIAVVNVDIAPDGFSGWHSHPGPVLVVVKSGTITFYRADNPNCAADVYGPGSSFTEQGGLVANATNKGTGPVVAVATFFAPPGIGLNGLRVDVTPAPENCVSNQNSQKD